MLVSNGMNIYNNGDMMKENCRCTSGVLKQRNPDSKVHGANMGPIWGRQDPVGPPVGPMNFATWEWLKHTPCTIYSIRSTVSIHFGMLQVTVKRLHAWLVYGPLTRYVTLRVAHAPAMPGTFSLAADCKGNRPASRHVRHAHAIMHVMIACPRWRGKRSRHSRHMRTRNFPYLARGPCTERYMASREWLWIIIVWSWWVICRPRTVSFPIRQRFRYLWNSLATHLTNNRNSLVMANPLSLSFLIALFRSLTSLR